ncbi:MAG TPA: aspartate-semialdehyde dehydrogenase [Kofleriaceae bacterium]|jgi:aspartate-semialdehyde dehydrogenase|nr:aspartate-semialdehyde dehydrogenase [Kofleriaceae bacterium]
MGTRSNRKHRVAIVGATGLTGQQFLAALANHPELEVTALAASSRSAGKPYGEAIRDASGLSAWYAAGTLDARIAALPVVAAEDLDAAAVDLVFSCVEAGPARELEPRYAQTTPVISTASAFRYEADVPLLLPGLNVDHVALVEVQKRKRGWKGFVLPNPNCTTVGLAMTLAPLHRAFGVDRVHMVSMQSVSGAGRSPGVIGLDIIDNIVPYIPKEEGKVETETLKILGTLQGEAIVPAAIKVSCTCTRVGVLEGHTEVVHLELSRSADEADIVNAWRGFGAELAGSGLPSAPPALIHVHTDPFRPQVRLDRDLGDGMTTVVGRLRRDEHAATGWKYMLVSHNTKMGAAKGCILLAEQLIRRGVIA